MSLNGRLQPSELVSVSGVLLSHTTARAFGRMAVACKLATGVTLDIVNGQGGYRDIDSQRDIWSNRLYYASLRPPIRIAEPGTSTHGHGTALDLTTTCWTPAVQRWLRAHAASYGFITPPANDPRHFKHNGVTTGPAGESETPIDIISTTPTPPEDQMVIFISAPNRGSAIVGANYFRSLSGANNGEEVEAARQIADRVLDVPTARFDTIRDILTSHNGITGRTLSSADINTIDGTLDEEFTQLSSQNLSILSAIAGVVTGGGDGDDPALTLAAVRELIADLPKAVNDDAAARMAD